MFQLTGNSYFWDNLIYSSNFRETVLFCFVLEPQEIKNCELKKKRKINK